MTYRTGDVVRLSNGLIGSIVKEVDGVHVVSTNLGTLTTGVTITNKIDNYIIDTEKCDGCDCYGLFLNSLNNEMLCEECYEITQSNLVSEKDDYDTEKELYHWGKI